MSKKTTNPAAGDAPKPITLIVTIYPPKKGQRHVMVSGAPEGEMPLIFTGIFQERHMLLDQAFAGVLKRDPQIVTLKDDKSKSITADPNAEEPGNREPDEDAASDQLVSDDESTDADAESVPVSPITGAEELPAIDGDIPAGAVAKFEAQLGDFISPEIEGDKAAAGADEDSDEVDDGEQD